MPASAIVAGATATAVCSFTVRPSLLGDRAGYFLKSAAWSAPGSWADRYASPGSLRSQVTGCGWPLAESSKTGASNCVSDGGVPSVALAMAHWTASRALSLPVATVNILKPGLVALWSSQKQDSTLPSEVTSAGMERPPFSNAGSAPTSDGPKSETMTSIFGYLAMAAVSTCWVSDGSQLVTSNGCWPTKVYLPVGSSTECSAWPSVMPWLLPAGPDRNSTLPPSGRF